MQQNEHISQIKINFRRQCSPNFLELALPDTEPKSTCESETIVPSIQKCIRLASEWLSLSISNYNFGMQNGSLALLIHKMESVCRNHGPLNLLSVTGRTEGSCRKYFECPGHLQLVSEIQTYLTLVFYEPFWNQDDPSCLAKPCTYMWKSPCHNRTCLEST